jgi:ATP-binding protein involved in chromosome partitioning
MKNPFRKPDADGKPVPANGEEPTKEQVLDALRTVQEPELHKDIVTLNMVKNLAVCGGVARFTVELTTPACPLKKEIEDSARAAVMRVEGMKEVNVEFSANVTSRMGVDRPSIQGLKNVIAVTSGKGGVGKSTCTVNLAVALAQSGARVGLLDCDVYGPDIPTMLGIKDKPSATPDRKFVPLERHGVKSMSVGYLVDEEAPIVWRGPMLHKVIEQFLKDVSWGELDYLLVDMPPGTGDAQLSLSQLVPLTGAVVVTTPQDVALVDVRKAIGMFQQVKVEILGIIENMAGFRCSHCGEVTHIFGEGGGNKLAERFGLPVLGHVPLDPKVRVGGDAGDPIVVSDPASPQAATFREIAGKLAALISVKNANESGAPSLAVLQ